MNFALGLGIAVCSLTACRGMSEHDDSVPMRTPAAPNGGSAGADSGEGGSSDGGQGGAPECEPVDTTNPFGAGTDRPNDECYRMDDGDSCALDGQVCEGIVCGVGRSGMHHCLCQNGAWTCTPCFLTLAPWWSEDLTETVEPCEAGTADLVSCTTPDEACGAANGELCVCYEDQQELLWDCDTVPSCGIIPP